MFRFARRRGLRRHVNVGNEEPVGAETTIPRASVRVATDHRAFREGRKRGEGVAEIGKRMLRTAPATASHHASYKPSVRPRHFAGRNKFSRSP